VAQLDEKTLKTIEETISGILDRLGYELWDIEFKGERGGHVLRVYMDKPGKVTVDDCAEASKRISMMLDVEDSIPMQYSLEVSSPGMDRKLVTTEHFNRYLERTISVKLHNSVVGRKKFSGRLQSCSDETLVVYDHNERQDHSIAREDIREARLVIEFKP